eukprot:232198_1
MIEHQGQWLYFVGIDEDTMVGNTNQRRITPNEIKQVVDSWCAKIDNHHTGLMYHEYEIPDLLWHYSFCPLFETIHDPTVKSNFTTLCDTSYENYWECMWISDPATIAKIAFNDIITKLINLDKQLTDVNLFDSGAIQHISDKATNQPTTNPTTDPTHMPTTDPTNRPRIQPANQPTNRGTQVTNVAFQQVANTIIEEIEKITAQLEVNLSTQMQQINREVRTIAASNDQLMRELTTLVNNKVNNDAINVQFGANSPTQPPAGHPVPVEQPTRQPTHEWLTVLPQDLDQIYVYIMKIEFNLRELLKDNNILQENDRSVITVVSAQKQIVSGINYKVGIDAAMYKDVI